MQKLSTTITVASYAELLGLTEVQRITRLKASAAGHASRFLEDGKILAILDSARTKGTLKGLVRQKLGADFAEHIGHGYKAAVVFGQMVLGEGEGHGKIAEADYDACKTTWLIRASAILNLLEKDNKRIGAETCAGHQETLAALLRKREAGTAEALEALWELIQPAAQEEQPEPGEGEGEGEGEGTGETADNSALVAELRARIKTLEEQSNARLAAVRSLAELTGKFALGANPEQLEQVAPDFIALPETIRADLVAAFTLRCETLGEPATVALEQIRIAMPDGTVMIGSPAPAALAAAA